MYLSRNPRPGIQFSLHQFTRFAHNQGRSHYYSVKNIYHCLVEMQSRGLTFDHNSDMKLDSYMYANF